MTESDVMPDTTQLREQLEVLHTASFGWALNCCRRDPSEAEDVLQSVYVKVLEGKARFRDESSFKTWLFAVIRTTAADRRRRGFLQGLKLGELAVAFGMRAPQSQPDELLALSESQRQLAGALEMLPARQREVLALVFYHDLTIAEAASVMNVSLGSARTHYERGKRRLRELLECREDPYESEWRARSAAREIS